MQITADRAGLAALLAEATAVAEKRSSMPILSNVLITAEPSKLEIAATDMEITFRGWTEPTHVEAPGRTTVHAGQLTEILKASTGSTVDLALEGSTLNINAGAAKFELPVLDAESFPETPTADQLDTLKMPGKDLAAALAMVEPSISREASRFNLTCVYVHEENGRLKLAATDGHRLSTQLTGWDTSGVSIPAEGLLLPTKAARLFRIKASAEADAAVQLCLGKGLMALRTPSVDIIARTGEGTFPQYEVVIPKRVKYTATVKRQALGALLKRMSILCTDHYHGVRMMFRPGGVLEVENQNPENGVSREALEIDYDGQDLTLGFNSTYFIETCKTMLSDEMGLGLTDDQSPCLIKGEGDEGFMQTIMTMRV